MKDYGYDPIGPDASGIYLARLVPSGKIVTVKEAQELLAKLRSNDTTHTERDIRNDCLGLSWDAIERKQGGRLNRNLD